MGKWSAAHLQPASITHTCLLSKHLCPMLASRSIYKVRQNSNLCHLATCSQPLFVHQHTRHPATSAPLLHTPASPRNHHKNAAQTHTQFFCNPISLTRDSCTTCPPCIASPAHCPSSSNSSVQTHHTTTHVAQTHPPDTHTHETYP